MTPQPAVAGPYDPILELKVIEGLVNLPEEFRSALELDQECFADPFHRRVFAACKSLHDQKRLANMDSVISQLEGKDRDAVAVLGWPNSTGANSWCESLLELRAARKVSRAAKAVHAMADGSTHAPGAFLDAASKAFAEALNSRPCGTEVATMSEAMSEVLAHIDARRSNQPVNTLSTGFHTLNHALGGLEPGRLYIVSGRTGMGKSALANQIALNVAGDGARVLSINLEMIPVEIGRRFASLKTGIDSRLIKSGQLSPEQMASVTRAAGWIANLPLEYPKVPDITIEELRRLARARRSQGLKLITVDILQQVKTSERASSREQEVSAVSRGLKQMALELEVPVLAVAQMNRDPEKRGGQRPGLSDLRESGAIENDADSVMLLYRDEYYNAKTEKPGVCEVSVAKSRDGETGMFEMLFEKKCVRFRDMEIRHG